MTQFVKTKMMKERFWSHVDKTGTCWNWKLSTNTYGYGQFRFAKGINMSAHRLSWQLSGNMLDNELTLDHLCRNKICVNPSHLEQVTSKENNLRGKTPAVLNSLKTHCKQGHKFTKENTSFAYGKYGRMRRCITCSNASCRRYYERNKKK